MPGRMILHLRTESDRQRRATHILPIHLRLRLVRQSCVLVVHDVLVVLREQLCCKFDLCTSEF